MIGEQAKLLLEATKVITADKMTALRDNSQKKQRKSKRSENEFKRVRDDWQLYRRFNYYYYYY
jgi:hypothetical protein